MTERKEREREKQEGGGGRKDVGTHSLPHSLPYFTHSPTRLTPLLHLLPASLTLSLTWLPHSLLPHSYASLPADFSASFTHSHTLHTLLLCLTHSTTSFIHFLIQLHHALFFLIHFPCSLILCPAHSVLTHSLTSLSHSPPPHSFPASLVLCLISE